ncbi:MAG: hypothetical protein V3V95_07415, partial [Thermodesulfobacteriota bacterium]
MAKKDTTKNKDDGGGTGNGGAGGGDKKKKQAIELAMSQIEKQFGKGSIMRLGEEGHPEEVPSI